MNTLISKLEQDDRILAELDNQLRSVSRRSNTAGGDDREPTSLLGGGTHSNRNGTGFKPLSSLAECSAVAGMEKSSSATKRVSSSLPSSSASILLNSNDVQEWKSTFQDYQSVLNTSDAPRLPNRSTTDYRSEPARKASSNTSTISHELKRIEESLAAVRSGPVDDPRSAISLKSSDNVRSGTGSRINLAKDHRSEMLSDRDPLKPLVSSKQSTKISDSCLSQEKKFNVNEKKQCSNVSSKELDLLMEKLERDNKILAELDKKLKHVSAVTGTTGTALDDCGTGLGGQQQQQQLSSSLPSYSNMPNRSTLAETTHISKSSNWNQPEPLPLVPYSNRSPAPITVRRVGPDQYHSQMDELKEAEEIVDSIELPNRGRCKVFMARYNYDPYKQSPNDNPDAEITLLAGDFILVFGNIDEDGYYYGELLDGRRGLVPSNFIEKLTGDDLFEFQARVLYGHNKDAESDTASFPPEFYDAILNEQLGHTNFQHLLAPDDFHRINDYIDLEDATEIDEDVSEPERAEQEAARTTVPPPQRLIVERQLHKSVLIGWLPPDCPRTMIDHYQIYVDGVLKATIPSGDRTKALVEGVDSSMPHRISIRAIDRNGRHSKDPGCTIVIGKNIPFAPCCVKASNITSDSALISWIPCNSNFYHVVAVNSVEVRTVKPSTYKHLITGLSANTLYRVSVRAKPGKLLCSDEKNPKKLEMLTTFVDFRTLPKSLPDPPVDIQVEAGPQEGTLLVTWLPITLNQFGTSNNCPVTGYAVFAGHKKLAEIDSPTGDHALLDIGSLEHLHKKQITVRTKSGENLSQDSMPCQIPDDLLKLANQNLPLKRMQIASDSESDCDHNRLMSNAIGRHRHDIVLQPQPERIPDQRAFVDQTTPYDMQRQRMIASNRQTNVANRIAAGGGRLVNRHGLQATGVHGTAGGMQHINDNMARMTIPAIEITKETPLTESIQPMESYSEEEFDQSMKHRVYGPKRTGQSPMPPQRTRVLSEYERSNLGPYNQISHRRPQNREHGVRWFVALFDYDPMTMSPNPDAAEEELPFQEGQLIKIYGDKDADGFYRGECNGRIGYVPCNMVSEVQYDVENDPRYRSNPNDPLSHLPIRKMIALYDYDPQELSPNFDTETELAFRTGDIIYVYGDMDEDGFYIGEANGMRGLVPSNFLADAGPLEQTNVRHVSRVKGGKRSNHWKSKAKMMSGAQSVQQHQQQIGVLQQHQQQIRPQMNQLGGMQMQGSQVQPGMVGQVMPGGQMQPGQMPPNAMTNPVQQQQMQPVVMQQQQQQPFGSQATTMVQGTFSQTAQQQPQTGGLFTGQLGQQQPTQQQQMLMQQQQSGQFQQQYQTGVNQPSVVGPNPQQQSQQQAMFQQTSGLGQQPGAQTQLQQQQNPLAANQARGVMRQQNPMMNAPGQGHFNQGLFQGPPGTNLGNKQRPNSLDLNMTTPRFGQQMVNQPGFGAGPGGMQQPQSNLQLPNQQQQQQQQSTGMLGSLFASGKKILEEATTPLGARGPFAHPNQPHQPMMGHQQGPMGGPQPQQQQPQAMGQFGQATQPGQYNPMMQGQPGQPGQQGQGTILNTMKNIFKL